ncbi:hypothetical protein BCF74_1079 [Knoellia remsis]|uniref:Uncharacterized protein n=1 Tax=Knoellia remsis TaxID=407159 RepID=A0A2T0UQN5_9MICO|nr:hypothetical protein BCF74_1079 [Knoellia remsis]
MTFAVVGPGVRDETLPAGPSPTASASKQVSATVFDGAYAVEVTQSADAGPADVAFYRIDGSARVRVGEARVQPNVVALQAIPGTGVLLGTAPDTLSKSIVHAPESTSGMETDTAVLPGTDYEVLAVRFEDPTEASTYVDTLWMDGEGVVRDAAGVTANSVRIDDQDTFFLGGRSQVVGVFTPDNAVLQQRGTDAATTLGIGKSMPQGSNSWRSYTLLTEGARDVKLTWQNADYQSDVVLKNLPGPLGTVAMADGVSEGGGDWPTVTQLSWTDPDGTRHTQPVN